MDSIRQLTLSVKAVAFLAEEAVPVVFPSYDQMSLPKKLAVTLAATLIPAALGTSAAVIIQHRASANASVSVKVSVDKVS